MKRITIVGVLTAALAVASFAGQLKPGHGLGFYGGG
jgi:hypothetical protein